MSESTSPEALSESEKAQLADVLAFMRDALARYDLYVRPGKRHGFRTDGHARAYMAQSRMQHERRDLERELVRWGKHAPYRLFLKEAAGSRRRSRKLKHGTYARASQTSSWQPDEDEIVEHAVTICQRVLSAPQNETSLGDFARTMRDLVTRGLVTREQTKTVAIGDDAQWRKYLADGLPKPRRGQRLGRKSAIAAVATFCGLSKDTIRRALDRAKTCGTTLEHREDMKRTFIRLGAEREADVLAGRETLPHPQK